MSGSGPWFEPATALLLGARLPGERISAPPAAGMALIGLSLLAVDGRLFARRRAGRASAGRAPG